LSRELEQLLASVDEARLTALLIEAVEQYSPSFSEEPALQTFAGRLEEAGVSYLRQPVPDPEGPSTEHRANLIVELGPQPPALMWVGHVDTVPLINDEEHGIERAGDTLHGLGTSDMKSGCAAAIEALTALATSGLPLERGLCVALVVGEEEYGDGSEALLQRATAPLTVIGEPTGLVPCLDHYGYYECRLTARGMRAHAALPEVGASAIDAMLEWMRAVLHEGRHSAYAESLVINLREIRGGTGLFTVAEECEAAIDIHLPPGVDRNAIDTLIEEARQASLATHPQCRLLAEGLYWAPGYTHESGSSRVAPLQRAFEDSGLDWDPSAFRSHSDGSLFYERGSVPVICGPGRLEVAHTREEQVSLAQVHQAARLYLALFYEACVAADQAPARGPAD